MTLKILIVIGARGGSKGVPGKNTRLIAGKPLIVWSIERAQAACVAEDIVVSTDSEEIASVAKQSGAKVPFIRPSELATSESGKFDVWKHALSESERIFQKRYDIFLDIDCTNPLLDVSDLKNTLAEFLIKRETTDADGILTVSASRRSPYFNLVETNQNNFIQTSKKLEQPILARQASPLTWDIVGGHYIFNAEYIRAGKGLFDGNILKYEVPAEKAFDIDEPLDFKLVEFLLRDKINYKN